MLTEARPVIVGRDGPDPASFVQEINTDLTAMLGDGTLPELSRSRFGGFDLSHPPVR